MQCFTELLIFNQMIDDRMLQLPLVQFGNVVGKHFRLNILFVIQILSVPWCSWTEVWLYSIWPSHPTFANPELDHLTWFNQSRLHSQRSTTCNLKHLCSAKYNNISPLEVRINCSCFSDKPDIECCHGNKWDMNDAIAFHLLRR